MAPPICQPPPFPRGQPATPYQQAVQPPGKSSGLGVTFDSSATKPATTGGQDANACGRQGTRGRDGNSQPTSHSKGAQERSSIRMTSKQMPHQEGGCPSGVPHNVPPASTPGSTLCQHGGGTRAPKDPLENVTNYRSQGWRKDLEHVFKAYYKYNVTSFKEAEWNKLRDKILEHLLQHQDEWRRIKENDPLQYMPYMKRQFHATTGIQLKGLSDFMGQIKWGSYYHGVVARKGKLHKCVHLAGVELPRWPQITPSESCQVSQRREGTPGTSPRAPNKKPSVAQVAPSDIPAPMETGGAGDSRSWAEWAEASTDNEFRRDRPAKCHRSESRRHGGQPTLPFPLQDDDGRCASVQQLYQHSGEQPQAHLDVATWGITHQYPDIEPHEAKSLGNQVLCMIAEYHLTSLTQGSSSISLVLLEVAQDLLPPVEDYLAGGEFQGSRDVRVVERAKTLRITGWLHRLDMVADRDETASPSLEATQHGRGPLLELLLAPMTSSLTLVEVVQCVLAKNRHRVESSLDILQEHRTHLWGELDDLTEALKKETIKSSCRRIKKEMDLIRKDLEGLSLAISQHESCLRRYEVEETTTSEDSSSDRGAGDAEEAKMAIMPVADDAPPVSATSQPSDPPPVEEEAPLMEVDEGNDGPPPSSPVSPGRTRC